MRAAVLTAAGSPLVIEDVPIPRPKAEEGEDGTGMMDRAMKWLG